MPREKDLSITIRVSKREKEILQAEAVRRGVSVSKLISEFIETIDPESEKALLRQQREEADRILAEMRQSLEDFRRRLEEK